MPVTGACGHPLDEPRCCKPSQGPKDTFLVVMNSNARYARVLVLEKDGVLILLAVPVIIITI
ncbi:hypothetical protein KXV22_009475 [Aspergillus fumigatus]|nr:hypothetical protein KXX30_003118 [Aspergillus fumigatus]KAH1373308.1 hypothetical protein KXX50_002902 [Aspergillus fumigatus]KAH1742536.1 hypothetical protein KXX09_000974 [Aspergillus fumigatus]KAH1770792.1 hypothetical protein KXX07_002929 [Aspergillus fumigatus]KAH1809915.1 hypothetical protein KXX19_007952 [Aspergillus fumigatus]